MPLRRLTKFSRIELETEKGELEATIERADRDPRRRAAAAQGGRRRAGRGRQAATARRDVPCCWSRPASPLTSAVPLEVADDPCRVLLSSTGLLARTHRRRAARHRRRPGQARRRRRGGSRPPHAARSASSPRRVGCSSSTCSTCPRCRRRRTRRTCRAARRSASSSRSIPASGSSALTSPVTRLARPRPRHAGGRGQAGAARSAQQPDSWDVIRLDDGDEVVGGVRAAQRRRRARLRHQRRPAAALPRFRRPAAGSLRRRHRRRPAGRRDPSGVLRRCSTPHADNVVVTVSGSCDALPGTEARQRQGDAVLGVPGARAAAPAASAATGSSRARTCSSRRSPGLPRRGRPPPAAAPVDLPAEAGRRDGSGTPAAQPIAAISGQLRE